MNKMTNEKNGKMKYVSKRNQWNYKKKHDCSDDGGVRAKSSKICTIFCCIRENFDDFLGFVVVVVKKLRKH